MYEYKLQSFINMEFTALLILYFIGIVLLTF